MNIGIIKPNYPNERRVALLPEHIEKNGINQLVVESGFGANLEISDEEYVQAGCKIASREDVYASCDAIFSLKLIQESDYKYLRDEHMIIGWTHPTGSGANFMKEQAETKNLIIVDLDNIYPTIFYKGKKFHIDEVPRNFIKKNSFYAGYASVMHALVCFGLIRIIQQK